MKYLLTLIILLPALAFTQNVPALRLAGTVYPSLSETARLMGYSASGSGESFTIGTPEGVLVVFRGSPEVFWTATGGSENEISLSAPVVQRDGQWYAPEELYGILRISASESGVALPDGRTLTLTFPSDPLALAGRRAYETVDLPNGVSALALYASGGAGLDSISMLLVDMTQLRRAYPDGSAMIDGFRNQGLRGTPLYFALTAVAESPWITTLAFGQGIRNVQVQFPAEMIVLEGYPGRVSPSDPVSGFILLPEGFDLHEPIAIRWGDVRATFQFRP